MRIEWKSPEDRARVCNGYRRAGEPRKTVQRDRYNVILLLGDGGPDGQELEREQIAAALQRSRQFVDEWARRYRKGGFDAIVPGKAKGNAPKLTPEQDAQLKARLNAGPTDEDGVCTLRGIDIVRIIKKEFGVVHTLGGIYVQASPTRDVLKRIGYSSLAPRPSHRKKDPQAVQTFIDGLSDPIDTDEHAILVLDNAGWHHAKALRWPANVTPMYLPPYSPELNPTENVWPFLRSHPLSNPVFENYESMLRRVDSAWESLDRARLRSLCRCP